MKINNPKNTGIKYGKIDKNINIIKSLINLKKLTQITNMKLKL